MISNFTDSLIEAFDNKIYFHASNNADLQKINIRVGKEGFHVALNKQDAIDRANMFIDYNYLYKVIIDSELRPLKFTRDLMQWNAWMLAYAIYHVIIGEPMAEGYEDFDIKNLIVNNEFTLDDANFFKQFLVAKNNMYSEKNLIKIYNFLMSRGYNSISYINEGENDLSSQTTSIILFGNKLIQDLELDSII